MYHIILAFNVWASITSHIRALARRNSFNFGEDKQKLNFLLTARQIENDLSVLLKYITPYSKVTLKMLRSIQLFEKFLAFYDI
jgi:hypothetical protein